MTGKNQLYLKWSEANPVLWTHTASSRSCFYHQGLLSHTLLTLCVTLVTKLQIKPFINPRQLTCTSGMLDQSFVWLIEVSYSDKVGSKHIMVWVFLLTVKHKCTRLQSNAIRHIHILRYVLVIHGLKIFNYLHQFTKKFKWSVTRRQRFSLLICRKKREYWHRSKKYLLV